MVSAEGLRLVLPSRVSVPSDAPFKTRRPPDRMGGEMQIDDLRATAARCVLEDVAWGDLVTANEDVRLTLERLRAATADDFLMWENEICGRYESEFRDEFSIPEDVVAARPPRHRRAYGVGVDPVSL